MYYKKLVAILAAAALCAQTVLPAMAAEPAQMQVQAAAEEDGEILEDFEDIEVLATEEEPPGENSTGEASGGEVTENTQGENIHEEDKEPAETEAVFQGEPIIEETNISEERTGENTEETETEEWESSEDEIRETEINEEPAGEEIAEEAVMGAAEEQCAFYIEVISNGQALRNVSGFTYAVYTDQSCTDCVGTCRAGSSGKLASPQLSPDTYYVRQETAPDGYEVADDVYEVTVAEGEICLLAAYVETSPEEFDIGDPPLPVETYEAAVSLYDGQDTTFTGHEVRPFLKVMYGKETLTEGEGYEVEYKDNINAGTATAHVRGIGSYDFEKDLTFEIRPHELTQEDVQTSLGKYNLRYNNHSYGTNTYIVAIPGYILKKNVDYTVEGEDAFKEGASGAEAVITGIGNCTGSVTIRIPEYDPMTVDISGSFVYGEEAKPVVSVRIGSRELVQGNSAGDGDYYVKSTFTSERIVRVEVIGEYKGAEIYEYQSIRVNPYTLQDENISVEKQEYEYTGSAIKPAVTVRANGKTLAKDTDYAVQYKNNVSKGTGSIIVTGTGNYTGTVTRTFTIKDGSSQSSSTEASSGDTIERGSLLIKKSPNSSYRLAGAKYGVYDTRAHAEALGSEGRLGTLEMDAGGEYTDSLSLSPGTYYVRQVTPPQGYGSIAADNEIITVQIKAGSQTILAVTFYPGKVTEVTPVVTVSPSSFVYNGKTQKPSITVKNGNTVIDASDYDVTWPSSVKAGTYKVTVTLKDSYSGTGTATYKINPKKITPKVTLSKTAFTYNGKTQKPTVTVKDGDTVLKASDYSTDMPSSIKAGTYKVTVTLKGSYSGTGTATYKINPKKTTPKVSLSKTAFTYNGKTQKPTVTVKDGDTGLKTTDYSVSCPASVKAGTYKVTVTLKGSYSGTGTAAYKISPKKITPKVTLSRTKYSYDGKAKKPGVTVKDGNTALKTSDYTVAYAKGRVNVGTYNVKVTMKGNYAGTKTVSFTVIPKGTSITLFEAVKNQLAFKVKWKKQPEQVTGYQIHYSTDGNFKKDVSSVTVKGAKNTSTVLKKNIKGGKSYYLRIRTYKTVGEKNYYSAWNYY